jgi:2-keto-4-pentenoate hydratase
MTPRDIDEAAARLAAARCGALLEALPTRAQPSTFAEAAAIQKAILALLGETAAGYKVAGTTPGTVMWGAILRSRLQASPGTFPASVVPMLGVEPEIAYRLERDITAADRAMTLDEFDRLTSVVPAIEIVDSRFTSYDGTPLLHRAADLMSNGGLVHGEPWMEVHRADLPALAVEVHAGGSLLAAKAGGHPAGDPRLPALAFLQAPGRPDLLPRGTLITTGSYAGLLRARPGDTVSARFVGYGSLAVSFAA